jgi:hypothetical protein
MQEILGEDFMINEIVPIEQPSVNVIKLTNDFVHNLPRPRHHTFVVNMLDVASACVMLSQGLLTIPITLGDTKIK